MTVRRGYKLGKRAPAVEATKARVLDAAFAEFSEHGFEHTSMQAIARRADVAAGTVLYHFKDVDTLVDAVVTRLLEQTDLPTADALPSGTPAERVVAAFELMYSFYDRADHLHVFYKRNFRHAAVQQGTETFECACATVIRRALGGRSRKKTTAAAITALLDVSFYGSLRREGLSLEQAIAQAAALATAAIGPGSSSLS